MTGTEPKSTNCAPLVDDLFLFCNERDFMTSLSADKDAEILEAFSSTSRHLDDLLLIIHISEVWSITFTHQNRS